MKEQAYVIVYCILGIPSKQTSLSVFNPVHPTTHAQMETLLAYKPTCGCEMPHTIELGGLRSEKLNYFIMYD